MDPTKGEKDDAQKKAERLMKKLGISGKYNLTEHEMCMAANLVDPLTVASSWEDIGGLTHTIEDIQETVILPFKRRELFQTSNLIQPPKGVLLYGPPGCGKTMIAKAIAKSANACFINLQIASLKDKWYGESQKRAEAVFTLATKLQPSIIFIDEIDSFLRARSSMDHEATSLLKTQFMSFWDGLMTDSRCSIMIIGATNRPQDLDAAILRRMPAMFHVGLPDALQRAEILDLILQDEPVADDVDLNEIADEALNYSGSDLKELCRNAAIYRIREFVKAEREAGLAHYSEGEEYCDAQTDLALHQLRPINGNDFQRALVKMRESNHFTRTGLPQNIELD
ncbi:hypothetical protein CAPTEDRAFT_148262 [Capitella teleta]|uniref:AAA+ ATPase domain-containing protein n=1 Tax=Capitella teleta TaxID=283909 RepID=R7UJZ8_CAPTE|nr:hypothetical protein CAPTEDRAFT_148262 [Capitella teleta]|eukprot:ELU06520.1 hypothetical protein CAPTEDRAFT_148262 [Capitella teleta]